MNKNKRRASMIAAKSLVFLIVIYFWFLFIRGNWAELSAYDWHVELGAISLSSAVFFLGYLVLGCLWAPMLFEVTGIRISLVESCRVSAISWMGRYVPGKVWALAGKAVMSAPQKGQMAQATVAAILETLWMQVSGLLLAIGFSPFCTHLNFPKATWPIAAVFMLASLLCIHPRFFCPVVNWGLGILRQAPLVRRPRYSVLLLMALGYACAYVFWTWGFLIFASSISSLSMENYPALLAVFTAAWVTGNLMPLAPAGLGIRELILAAALAGMGLDVATIIILTIGTRLLSTCVEMICFCLGIAMPVSNRKEGGIIENA